MSLRKNITLIICASLFLTGCTPINMSNLTGKGALANSDIIFPKEDENNESEVTQNTETIQNTEKENQTQTPTNPTISNTDTEVKPTSKNKTGSIAFKQYILKGKNTLPFTTPVLIQTTEEYQKTMSSLTSYSNINKIDGSILNDYFLFLIPINNTNGTWEYFVDSVKNDKTLNITVICEKKANTQNDGTNMYIVTAISRTDIPNTPDESQINIKHNSYTIE